MLARKGRLLFQQRSDRHFLACIQEGMQWFVEASNGR